MPAGLHRARCARSADAWCIPRAAGGIRSLVPRGETGQTVAQTEPIAGRQDPGEFRLPVQSEHRTGEDCDAGDLRVRATPGDDSAARPTGHRQDAPGGGDRRQVGRERDQYDDLIEWMHRMKDPALQGPRRPRYLSVPLLIVDELGFQALDRRDAHRLFQLVNFRYERSSTIIISNKSISEWPAMLAGDEALAAAIL